MYRRTAVLALAAALAAEVALAEPLLGVTDGGRTLLYRSRAGDSPGSVAAMFGIPADEVGAFLRENGITDPTRVGVGFVYRIPNRGVRANAERLATLETENARLSREAAGVREEGARLAREAEDARRGAALAGEKAARLGRLDALWPLVQAALVLLGVVTGGMALLASAAVRRQRQVERRLQSMTQELDDKRRAALAERQEAARRALDLEERVRTLEGQLGPKVVLRR